MGHYFCIKYIDENSKAHYVEIPDDDCRDKKELVLVDEFSGRENQKWMWDENRIVSSISSPNFSIAVPTVQPSSPIVLRFRELESIGECHNVRWKHEDGLLRVENEPEFYIGVRHNVMVLLPIKEGTEPTRWETQVIKEEQNKKANTCILEYEAPQHMPLKDCWTIENTICVRKSCDDSYFSVINFLPGGHAGLQQVNEEKQLAIYTLFDAGFHNVEVAKQGDGVEVTQFEDDSNVTNAENIGDVGKSGMMATKEIPCMKYQEIRFKVTGEKLIEGSGIEGVPKNRCTCWYSIGKSNEWEYIATFERTGKKPLFNLHLSAYIKDLTPTESQSHAIQRLAEFSQAKLILGKGTEEKKERKKNKRTINEVFDYREGTFNVLAIGEEDLGELAELKSFGAVKTSSHCFILSTGGQIGADIFGMLSADGYGQRTNKRETKLFLPMV